MASIQQFEKNQNSVLPSRPLALSRFGFQGVGFKFGFELGRDQRIRRTQCGTWNPKPYNLKPRSGWVVVVKVETVEEGAERCPAAIGSDSLAFQNKDTEESCKL